MASYIVSEPRKISYLIDVEHDAERADGGGKERGGELEDKRLKRKGTEEWLASRLNRKEITKTYSKT
jgi:hypothetical protein